MQARLARPSAAVSLGVRPGLALGVAAALANLPVREQPLARPQTA